ncbi:MAG: aspartate aminotransferase family protein [Alphaproteobacteria bacterium]
MNSAMTSVATGHVFHRYPADELPMAAGGEGIYLIDTAGKRYLDASGGAAVSCLGHGHKAVVQAMREQADRLAYAHTRFFTNAPMEALADSLAADAPGELDRVYFTSGGSEGVDTALKMARQYFVEIGQPARRHIIARRQSFHGNTLGALSAGGNQWRRAPFEPLLLDTVRLIDPCYPYREQGENESDEEYGSRAAQALEREITALGAENVIAFIAEPVVGATLGAVPPAPGYFRRIREICDAHGVLLILDEVMCGMGRTGTLFACEQEGVVPDMVVVAKGLAGGYQPIGAVIAQRRIFEAFVNGSGFFQHGHTYMGHAVACAAALAVQRTIREENLLENVRRRGEGLGERLRARFGNHHHVGEIRGRGLMRAIELVADRASKAPFPPEVKLASAVRREAMDRGLICYPMGGVIDGRSGDHVMLAPPFIVSAQEIDLIVDRLGEAVDAAIHGVSA